MAGDQLRKSWSKFTGANTAQVNLLRIQDVQKLLEVIISVTQLQHEAGMQHEARIPPTVPWPTSPLMHLHDAAVFATVAAGVILFLLYL